MYIYSLYLEHVFIRSEFKCLPVNDKSDIRKTGQFTAREYPLESGGSGGE